MKSAQQWWRETSGDERWMDDPPAVLDLVMRDAFACGMTAGIERAAVVAARSGSKLPHASHYQTSTLASLIRATDLELYVGAAFDFALLQPAAKPEPAGEPVQEEDA